MVLQRKISEMVRLAHQDIEYQCWNTAWSCHCYDQVLRHARSVQSLPITILSLWIELDRRVGAQPHLRLFGELD